MVAAAATALPVTVLPITLISVGPTLLLRGKYILHYKRMLLIGAIVSPRGTGERLDGRPTNRIRQGGAHNTQNEQATRQQLVGGP